jgi:hypothetical protein
MLDVLNIYLIDKAPKHSDPTITKARIMTLAGWWGDKTLADVNGTRPAGNTSLTGLRSLGARQSQR